MALAAQSAPSTPTAPAPTNPTDTPQTESLWRPAAVLFTALTLVTGLVYPLAVTALAQLAFPHAANGSLIVRNGKVIGSELIGQNFSDPRHFWGRPSATAPTPYNAVSTGGSNFGPTSPALIQAVQARIDALRAADPGNRQPLPVDLVTASASGLDPEISRAAADYQLPRVARLRGLSEAEVREVIDTHTEGRRFGFLGEARVNVLQLNLALDATAPRGR